MARLIDANKLLTILKERTTDEWNSKVAPMSWAYAYTDFADMIDTQPTVDAVPVVRCKDCIGKDTWYKNEAFGFDICGLSGLYVVEDIDYCSYGERIEE